MKHIVISCFLIGFSLCAQAQSVPNAGFEDWLFRGSFYDPDYWFTYNGDLENAGVSPNITRDTVAHSGKYAVSLKTVKLPDNSKIPGYMTLETDLALKPSSVSGWYKYTGGGDTAVMYSRIFRRTGGQVHIIQEAYYVFTATQSAFTQFTMPYFKQQPYGDETPDSCYFFIFSGKNEGSQLILDDLSYGPLMSISEPVFSAAGLQVYPNPAKGNTNISISLNQAASGTISVMNLTGSVVLPAQSYSLASGNNSIPMDLSALPAGLYLLRFETAAETRTLRLMIEP